MYDYSAGTTDMYMVWFMYISVAPA